MLTLHYYNFLISQSTLTTKFLYKCYLSEMRILVRLRMTYAHFQSTKSILHFFYHIQVKKCSNGPHLLSIKKKTMYQYRNLDTDAKVLIWIIFCYKKYYVSSLKSKPMVFYWNSNIIFIFICLISCGLKRAKFFFEKLFVI